MLINNIVFLALQQLSPISFIALGNLKTVTTAIFFFLCLGRGLTKLQWHALGLLTLGAMMTQVREPSPCTLSPPTFSLPPPSRFDLAAQAHRQGHMPHNTASDMPQIVRSANLIYRPLRWAVDREFV